jgi:hypothetical protein
MQLSIDHHLEVARISHLFHIIIPIGEFGLGYDEGTGPGLARSERDLVEVFEFLDGTCN